MARTSKRAHTSTAPPPLRFWEVTFSFLTPPLETSTRTHKALALALALALVLPHPHPIAMDADSELQFDFSPFVRLYKSGRVERLMTTSFVPASPVDPDPATGVLSKDVPIDPDRGVSARLYLPAGDLAADGVAAAAAAKLPIVVYFHGGAFCVESAFSPLYHGYLNSLVARARVVAVSVEYRLAPEHPLPAAYDDAWAALKWAASNAASGPEPWLAARGDLRRVFLAGDSAGANIAHSTAVRAAEEEADPGFAIKGLVLLNPYFAGGEEPRDEGARARMEGAWGFVCAGRYGIEHPQANPAGWPERLKALPCERALVAVAERDHLRGRGIAYAEGLRRSGWGGEVELHDAEGEDHVYFLFKPHCESASDLMDTVVSFVNRN